MRKAPRATAANPETAFPTWLRFAPDEEVAAEAAADAADEAPLRADEAAPIDMDIDPDIDIEDEPLLLLSDREEEPAAAAAEDADDDIIEEVADPATVDATDPLFKQEELVPWPTVTWSE